MDPKPTPGDARPNPPESAFPFLDLNDPHHPGEESNVAGSLTGAIVARLGVFLGVTILTLAGVVVWTLSLPQIYDATSSIILNLEAPRVLGPSEDAYRILQESPRSRMTFETYLQTQLEVLHSSPVAERVVDQLHLDSMEDFIGPPAAGTTPTAEERRRKAITITLDRLRVIPVPGSMMVRLTFWDENPRRASEVANAVVDAYIDYILEREEMQSSRAVRWLEEQKTQIAGSVAASETALFEFRQRNQLLSRDQGKGVNTSTQRVDGLGIQLTAAEVRRIELQSRRDSTATFMQTYAGDVPTHMAEDPVVQSLRLRLVELAANHADEASHYGPRHGSVIQLKAELEEVQRLLSNEVSGILARLDADLQEAIASEAALRGRLEGQTAEAVERSRIEGEYAQLERRLDDERRLSQLITERLTNTELGSRLKTTNVYRHERAQPPVRPSRPRVPVNIAFGLLLGLFMGTLAAFAADNLDDAIRHEGEIERRTGLHVLGVVPTVRTGRGDVKPAPRSPHRQGLADRYVLEHPQSIYAESFRTIRTNLQFMRRSDGKRSLLVTSASVGDGKTSVSTNLAAAFAATGKRVLVIDTDLRRPCVHAVFGLDNSVGLGQVLVGELALAEAIRPVSDTLFVLGCGPIPPNPSELLASPAFGSLVQVLERDFDILVFDSPPVGVVSDAAILSGLVDDVVLVARAGVTHRRSFLSAVRSLRAVGSKILGCVVNEVDRRSGSYAYYAYRGYGYSSYTHPEKVDPAVDRAG